MSAKEHTQKGWNYEKQGKTEEAMREYQEALRIDPNFALARSNLGEIYHRQGKMDDAIREWEETLRRGVDSAIVRGNTEDWLREAKALRDERAKQVTDVDAAVTSYVDELGKASSTWYVAYDALARIGAPAVGALIEAMESDNRLLWGRAMDLLGKIGDPRAIEPLTKASKISWEDFRKIARTSGTSLTVYYGSTPVQVQLSDLWEEYRQNAKGALKRIKKEPSWKFW